MSNQSLTYCIKWLYGVLNTGLKPDGSAFVIPGASLGTPVAGSLSATTSGAALSATSIPCKGLLVFPTDASADIYIGDSSSQPCRIPSIPIMIPTDNVNKIYGKLSTGTGTIPWIALT